MGKLDTWLAERLKPADDDDADEQTIEAKTADAWASRAVKAWRQYSKTQDNRALMRGERMAHEALEHSAEAPPQKITELRDMLAGARKRYGVPAP
jgi:hypothetical protein